DFFDQLGARLRFDFVYRAGGVQNIVRRYAAAFARKLVAAARTADALENTVADQGLEHRFQMARRQAVTRGERLGGDRPPVSLQRHIDDGGDCEESFARK